MAAEDLPSEFDVVILGTGLAESVVAAAFSRVGQRVLHVDRQSYYAANWASFTFNGLLTWIQQHHEESQSQEVQDCSALLEEGERLIYLSNPSSIRNVQVHCFTSEEDETEEDEEEASSPDPPITTEEETGGAEEERSEMESADVKEEDTKECLDESGNGEDEKQASQAEGEEPEADQPTPSAAQSQSEPIKKKISYSQLVREGRRFNIDLVSKLMYSRGSLVDLLIKSNVSRYAEFKNVSRILTFRNGNVEQVPCSRADVFASRELSVVEKRKLMRFLSSCMDETVEQQTYNGRPYLEFLRDQQLGDTLQHFLLHSIAMVTEDTPTEEGLASTRHLLRSLGRYGNTPFLFPVYGLGEIPQCFCRMCAVFGGIYCLRHSVNCLVVDKDTNRCKAVIDSRGQRISCNHFVVEEGYVSEDSKRVNAPSETSLTNGTAPSEESLHTSCFISRAVLITDRSILPSDSDQEVSIVTIPQISAGCPAVRMVELCSSTMTCMPGTYLVHLTCKSVGSAYEDLSPVVMRMFRTSESDDNENCPSVLWCLYFNMADTSGLEIQDPNLPSNVYLCSGPDGTVGHEHSIKQAESIFQKILPDEEFCPPAPNPEDIIYDGDDTTLSSGGGDEDTKENQEKDGEEEVLAEQCLPTEENQEKHGAGEEEVLAEQCLLNQEKDGAGEEEVSAEQCLPTEE